MEEERGLNVSVQTKLRLWLDYALEHSVPPVDLFGYIAKPTGQNGDLVVAYTSATTLTLSSFPAGVATIYATDIEAIRQVNSLGIEVAVYTQDNARITMAGAVITVAGAAFLATDLFTVFTSIIREIEISSTGVSSGGGYIGGDSANLDFTTAYLGASTITLSNYPTGIAAFAADDIEMVKQINTGGTVVALYSRDDALMTIVANVLTVTGAAFAATDTFVVYTNVPRLPERVVDETTMPATPDILPVAGEYRATATAYTDGDAAVLQMDSAGRLQVTGGAGVPPYTHSSARGDFTAAFTSNVTITLAGEPAVVVDRQIAFIRVTDTAGTTVTLFVNGVNGVAMSIAASVITITGAGTPFTAGDDYDVGLNLFDKGYAIADDAFKHLLLNPGYAHYTDSELISESNLGIDGTHDGGDNVTNFTDTGEVYTAETVAEGYTIYNVTDGCSAVIDADSLYGLAVDGGAGNPTADDIEHGALAGGGDNDWDDTEVASIPEVKRFEIDMQGFNFASIDVLLDSQDGNNSLYCKVYLTNDSNADTTDDTYWNDVSVGVFGAAQLTADGITAGARTVYKNEHFIDRETVALKMMLKVVAECDNGTQNNETTINVKKGY